MFNLTDEQLLTTVIDMICDPQIDAEQIHL